MPSVKNIGKPYAGKLHVRFDEGESGTYPPTLSTLPVMFCFFAMLSKYDKSYILNLL